MPEENIRSVLFWDIAQGIVVIP